MCDNINQKTQAAELAYLRIGVMCDNIYYSGKNLQRKRGKFFERKLLSLRFLPVRGIIEKTVVIR